MDSISAGLIAHELVFFLDARTILNRVAQLFGLNASFSRVPENASPTFSLVA